MKEAPGFHEQANQFVNDKEAEDLRKKWAEFATYEAARANGDPVADRLGDEVLDKIECENIRLDPGHKDSFDHEEVWRVVGEYRHPLDGDNWW